MFKRLRHLSVLLLLCISTPAIATTSDTLSLDGADDRLVITNEGVLNPSDGITIEAWVYPLTVSGCQAIVSKGNDQGYWLGICSGAIRYYIHGSGTSYDSQETINPGEWTHIAVSFNGTALKQYINGKEVGHYFAPGPLPVTTTDLGIGGDASSTVSIPYTNYYGWEGSLAEVRLWSIARSEQQIREDMVRQIDEAREGLIGVWTLDGAATEVNSRFETRLAGGAGFGFGIAAPPEPHEPLQIGRLGDAPTVDGNCDQGEYDAGSWLPIWVDDSSVVDGTADPLRAHIGATASSVYVCVPSMSENDLDKISVYLDTQGDGSNSSIEDDYHFYLMASGSDGVLVGSSAVPSTLAGFETSVGGFEFDWNAELKIPRSILPSDDAIFGLNLLRSHRHDGEFTRHVWPFGSDSTLRQTWASAQVDDTSTPRPDSRAPMFENLYSGGSRIGFLPQDTQPREGVEFTIQAIANDDTDLRSVSIFVDDERFRTREAEETCIEDGNADTSARCTLSVTLPVGIHHMTAKAVDHRGRVSFAGPERFKVIVDGEPPVVELNADPQSPSPGDTVTVTATVADPSGIDYVNLHGGRPFSSKRCDLGGAAEGSCSIDVGSDTDSTLFRARATAKDMEGFETRTVRGIVFDTGDRDRDGDGLSDDVEEALCTSITEPDTDRDGLIDSWEVEGLYFTDGDHLNLPALGAKPCMRDVFLQIDYEEGARLPRNGVDEAILRYRNHGINLHIEENKRPRLNNSDNVAGLHAAYQQEDDGSYWFPPRRNWTHLYMFSRHVEGRSGMGRGGTITVDYDAKGSSDLTYRLIHELGHGVGLGHGGREGTRVAIEDPDGFFYLHNRWVNKNFKPNHRSVMNYLWNVFGPMCATAAGNVGTFTYSSGDLPALDESSLDESPDSEFAQALQEADCPDSAPGATPVTFYACMDPDEAGIGSDSQARYIMMTDGSQTLARFRHGGTWDTTPPSHDPGIDWNCNGVIDSEPVSGSVNGHGLSTGTRWPFSGADETCDGKDNDNDGTTDEFCNWAIDSDPLADSDEWGSIPNLKKVHWSYDDDDSDDDGNRCYRHPSDYRDAMGTLVDEIGPVDGRPDDSAPDWHCPRDQVTAIPDTSTGVPEGGIPPPPGTEFCNGRDDDGDGELDEGCADSDGDSVVDALDLCPHTADPQQIDRDGDRLGDACESPEVTDLTLNQDGDKMILNWDGTTTDTRGFAVYRETAETPAPVFVGQQFPTTRETTFTETPPDSAYYRYTVYAVDLNGDEKGRAVAEVGEPPSDDTNGGDNGNAISTGGGGGGCSFNPQANADASLLLLFPLAFARFLYIRMRKTRFGKSGRGRSVFVKN